GGNGGGGDAGPFQTRLSGCRAGRPSIRRATSRSARKACAIPRRLLSWKTRTAPTGIAGPFDCHGESLWPASIVLQCDTQKLADRVDLGQRSNFVGARPTFSELRPSNRIYGYAPPEPMSY